MKGDMDMFQNLRMFLDAAAKFGQVTNVTVYDGKQAYVTVKQDGKEIKFQMEQEADNAAV